MRGILKIIGQELYIITERETQYPIHQSSIKLPPDSFVEFELIDEFTNPEFYEGVGWGDGIKYALIKK